MGIKQGRILSRCLRELLEVDTNIWIQFGEDIVPGLLFADDMVLIASDEKTTKVARNNSKAWGEKNKEI